MIFSFNKYLVVFTVWTTGQKMKSKPLVSIIVTYLKWIERAMNYYFWFGYWLSYHRHLTLSEKEKNNKKKTETWMWKKREKETNKIGNQECVERCWRSLISLDNIIVARSCHSHFPLTLITNDKMLASPGSNGLLFFFLSSFLQLTFWFRFEMVFMLFLSFFFFFLFSYIFFCFYFYCLHR